MENQGKHQSEIAIYDTAYVTKICVNFDEEIPRITNRDVLIFSIEIFVIV